MSTPNPSESFPRTIPRASLSTTKPILYLCAVSHGVNVSDLFPATCCNELAGLLSIAIHAAQFLAHFEPLHSILGTSKFTEQISQHPQVPNLPSRRLRAGEKRPARPRVRKSRRLENSVTMGIVSSVARLEESDRGSETQRQHHQLCSCRLGIRVRSERASRLKRKQLLAVACELLPARTPCPPSPSRLRIYRQ